MNILIIDNSSTLSQIIVRTLESYDYRTTLDNENFESMPLLKDNRFDIVILNTSLPENKSFKILKYIQKASPSTKIIGICRKEDWKNKVQFLQDGGDDVLTYPFPMQELLARIQCLNRRSWKNNSERLYISGIEVDTGIKSATKGNQEIPFRKQEYSLFEYLVKNKGRTVTRYELMDHVWDYRRFTNSNTIDVHIKRIRDKIGDRNLIQTVHGIGYKIIDMKPKAS